MSSFSGGAVSNGIAEKVADARAKILARAAQGHRRAGRGGRSGPGGALHGRALPDHRRAGPGQDAADQDAGRDSGPELQAHPVHARPDALGHHRHRDPRRKQRRARAALRAGPDLRADHPRRRDQPHAAQDAGRAARGDAGVPRHGRRPHLRAGTAVLRAGHAEPDRARGHVSAAGGAARSLHVQHRHEVPQRGRGGAGRHRDHRGRAAPSLARAGRTPTSCRFRGWCGRCWWPKTSRATPCSW